MIHFIRFNVVGLFGFALQSGALFVLTHSAHPIGYLAATAAAVELAILNNFVWHQRWTWKDRPSATTGETLRRLAKFNVTNGAVSITGNLVLMSILVGRLSLPIAGANVASVAACSICNFFLADRIAFYVDNGSTKGKSRRAEGPSMAAAGKARARQAR
jgi:putative flippase GtrA